MHFVTGGAFNGKRSWVKNRYQVTDIDRWNSAYDLSSFPTDLSEMEEDLIILEGLEVWIKGLTNVFDSNKCREIWNSCLDNWLNWERAEPNRKLVLIGTDISKGIVPMEKENRLWRDVTGWVYQDCAKKSEKMDIIWYGINQTIK